MPTGDLLAVVEALGADLEVRIRWRGEGLDRLLDAAHSALTDLVVRLLEDSGWETAVEVSFSIGGERGSVDVLAWHAATATVLIIEVKSLVPDAQAMLVTHDRKVRLAEQIAASRGWRPRQVARLLVVGDRSAARQRIRALRSMFEVAYPSRAREVRSWLRDPGLPRRGGRPFSGLLFLPYVHGMSTKSDVAPRQRVRTRGGRGPVATTSMG